MRNLLRENAKYAFDEERADKFIERSMEVQRLHADMDKEFICRAMLLAKEVGCTIDKEFICRAMLLAKEVGCTIDTALIVTALRSIGFDNELKIFNAPYDLEEK